MGRRDGVTNSVTHKAGTIIVWAIVGPAIAVLQVSRFTRLTARKLRLGIRDAKHRYRARQHRAKLQSVPTAPIKSRTKRQTCALLTRLPREVRDLIWNLVVGEQEVEIGRGTTIPQLHLPKRLPHNRLALLRTCHQVHEEAAMVFYTTTRFTLLLVGAYSKYTLHEFRAVLPVAHWEAIRHLQLYYGFYTVDKGAGGCVAGNRILVGVWGPRQWPAVCDALASLTGLHYLTVILTGAYTDAEGGSLRELEKVTTPKSFEVWTTSTWDFRNYLLSKQPPFQVRKATADGLARHMTVTVPRTNKGNESRSDMAKMYAMDEAIADVWDDASNAS